MSLRKLSDSVGNAEPLAVCPHEAARLLGVSERTLHNWRRGGIGPPYHRVIGRVLYSVDAIRSWLSSGPIANGVDTADGGLGND